MILSGDVKKNEVLRTPGTEGTKVGIDQGSVHVLQMLLSTGLYTDPITAIIAEYTNNGIDSIVESGKDPIEHPVVVTIGKDLHGCKQSFSVKDEGLGLSEAEFIDVLGCYLKSTKRNDNKTLGCFGIGSKSALALTSTFYYVCRKDGIEAKFMVFKGDAFTEYEKIYEKATDEVNGVEVIVPIDGWSDYNAFCTKAKQKLCYYDTAVLIINEQIVSNKIYRSELFQWASLNENKYIHFSLKDVYYKIEWDKLGINAIELPICIRFGLDDGLMPTPSRESIVYNKDTIALITKKLKEVANWFVEHYNNSVKNIKFEDIPDLLESMNPYGPLNYEIEGQLFDVKSFKNIATIQTLVPNIESLKLVTPGIIYSNRYYLTSHLIACGYSDKYRFEIGKRAMRNDSESLPWLRKKGDHVHIVCPETPRGLLKEYIADLFEEKNMVMYYRTSNGLSTADDYRQKFDLRALKTNEQIGEFIKEWKSVSKLFTSKLVPIEKFPITEEWLAERKANRIKKTGTTTRVAKNEVNIRRLYKATQRRIRSGYTLGENTVRQLSELTDTDRPIIYGLLQDKTNYDEALALGLEVWLTSRRDISRLDAGAPDNWMSWEEFMKGDTKFFKSVCLCYKTNQQFRELSDRKSGFMREIYPWYNRVVKLLSSRATTQSQLIKLPLVEYLLIPVAEKQDWYRDNLDKLVEKCIQTRNEANLDFINYISTHSQEGMDLVKEVYFSRLEKQKQLCKND